MIRTLALPVLALVAGTVPGYAIDVAKTATVATPPAKVWQTIGDFCGIGDWHPAVEKCAPSEKDGMKVRTLSLKGGGTLVEEQVSRDDKVMSYTYTILSGPLPVSDYKSTLSVAPDGTGSKLSWTGTFNAKGAPDTVATDAISGIYESGLKAIADKAK
ncbi:IS1595 family transposase ISMpo2 [Methylobacterium cerastii]|uniref:IS1595 family transposase ISMpo2 n=1 Tax=Methylobacterium cerastii TaxID=932741 RepID=A0ABQ4QH32_9HYPH|nr:MULTISPECIES: SRPBCC family protein [Methylobacterium]TXN14095.1 SRPBCC family protein [Methylobacterium sp. WL122]TXN80054.1 SRPBCC family protein [Methylobacterium sp. WL8]GJD44564.1 IS1595 family transposase ISMpo2 [Methylobacterium cerastii]